MKHTAHSFIQLACFMGMALSTTAAFAAAAPASEIGIVMNVEGSLSAKGSDGKLRMLAGRDKVFGGDVLFTGKDSYARVKFSDGGQISLRPTSQFKIEKFNFDEKQPGKDAAEFNLIKGAMRSISGMIGKRGDPDSYSVKTREATAGIRGTKFGVRLCKADCDDTPLPDGSPIPDGTHFDVLEGTIIVKNASGSQLLNQGQFGYVGSVSTPPSIVPPERAIRVEIPAKISLDKIRGNTDKDDQGRKTGADNGKVEGAGATAAKTADQPSSGNPESGGENSGESSGGAGGGDGGTAVCPI